MAEQKLSNPSTKALVVLSGGLDSTTCLAMALRAADDVETVTFYYGQKHKSELEAAKRVADYYAVAHHIIDLPQIFAGTSSTLVEANQIDNPRMSYQEIEEVVGESVSPTYVPYRNGNLLSMATTLALVRNADTVWAGMHAEDAAHWAYPDCTPEFLGAMANAIYVGSYRKVRLVTPLQWHSKADIVRVGTQLQAPYHLTLSCYDGITPACGTCPTCVGRINAFRANGLADPIPYAIDIEW